MTANVEDLKNVLCDLEAFAVHLLSPPGVDPQAGGGGVTRIPACMISKVRKSFPALPGLIAPTRVQQTGSR
jgi:hypothetical protein